MALESVNFEVLMLQKWLDGKNGITFLVETKTTLKKLPFWCIQIPSQKHKLGKTSKHQNTNTFCFFLHGKTITASIRGQKLFHPDTFLVLRIPQVMGASGVATAAVAATRRGARSTGTKRTQQVVRLAQREGLAGLTTLAQETAWWKLEPYPKSWFLLWRI